MRNNPKKMNNKKTYLSAYWVGGRIKNLNAENMSAALKFATTALNYPSLKGITIDRVDTHSLRSMGANALYLVGYSDRDIQKWGDGEEELLRNTKEKNYIVLRKACRLQ